jgi:hypothetical protein
MLMHSNMVPALQDDYHWRSLVSAYLENVEIHHSFDLFKDFDFSSIQRDHYCPLGSDCTDEGHFVPFDSAVKNQRI